MTGLSRIHFDIDARVSAIRASRHDWLCGKGCDGCCRRLAEVPRLTVAEWHLLQGALVALPSERFAEISRDVSALGARRGQTDLEGRREPVVCPLLDKATGICPVYAQRPVACRTYGFYVQRDKGLYCADIESLVAVGVLDDVMWGNHDAVDQRLADLGESRTLPEWFGRWQSADR